VEATSSVFSNEQEVLIHHGEIERDSSLGKSLRVDAVFEPSPNVITEKPSPRFVEYCGSFTSTEEMLSNVGRMKRQSRLSVTHILYRSFFNITGTLKDGVIVGAYAEVKHSFPQEVSHLTIRVCIYQSV
jgi:hypothetical protein